MRLFSIPGKLIRLVTRFLLPNVLLAAFAILFLYLSELRFVKYFFICPLHLLGLYCPTCGMTRAARALLRLDFSAAFRYHPLLPLFVLMVLYYEIVHLRAVLTKQPPRRPRWMLMFTVFMFLAFFVVRNVLLFVFDIDLVGDFIK